MPVRSPLTQPSDRVFLYDGSLMGLYCCIHEAVYSHQRPLDILREGDELGSLIPGIQVRHDRQNALRVRDALRKKVCPRAMELTEAVFFSCLENKELAILDFVLLAFETGSGVVNTLTHPAVHAMTQAERHLLGEAHLLKGFVRFADAGGNLISTIGPKNFVLPFIAPYFMDRFQNENFMIYDETHHAALLYQYGSGQIVESMEPPSFEISETEAGYQALWKHFYHTIGIEARVNERCRRTHMPKRYWAYMTEMHEQL